MNNIFFDKCILCNSSINLTTPPEHVIPNFLGGRLKQFFLCENCNKGLGAKLYAKLKYDFFIRKAAYLLRNELPRIYKSVENTQIYKTVSPAGAILKAQGGNEGIKIIPKKDNNLVVLPTDDAIKYLEKQLVREGKDIIDAKSISEKIIKTPNDKLERISERYKIIRWDAKEFQLDYSSNSIVDNTVVSLMAFEYLAILLGKSIYMPIFDDIRRDILTGVQNKYVKVDFFTSPKPQPFHLIYPEFEKDRTRISIHFFEYMLAKIEFINIHINSDLDFCYLEDLVSKESFGAFSVVDGKSNKWRKFAF